MNLNLEQLRAQVNDVFAETAAFRRDIHIGSLTPPSSKILSKRCKRLIFLSIS